MQLPAGCAQVTHIFLPLLCLALFPLSSGPHSMGNSMESWRHLNKKRSIISSTYQRPKGSQVSIMRDLRHLRYTSEVPTIHISKSAQSPCSLSWGESAIMGWHSSHEVNKCSDMRCNENRTHVNCMQPLFISSFSLTHRQSSEYKCDSRQPFNRTHAAILVITM